MNVVFPLCAVTLTILLGYKFRHLRSRWSNARVWALCATVFFFALSMWSAFPAGAIWITRTSGVPNLAELLTAVFLCALGASFLLLALLWRYPTATARPKIRWVLAVYSLVIAAITVLFMVSDVPVERPVDFTFYYARQPTVAAMYSIYYVSTAIGATVLARWCFVWARHEDYASLPYLRRGLRLYGGAGIVLGVYSVVRLATMAANWAGSSALNPVGNDITVAAALGGCVLLGSALTVPVWGPRWRRVRRSVRLWADLWTLRPLRRALRETNPDVVFVAPGRRLDVQHRIRRAMIELSDWRWTLAPMFDPAVREAVCALGPRLGLTAGQLPVAVEAAQLRAALDAWRRGARAGDFPADRFSDERDGTDLDGELAWWCQVARAFDRSAVVDRALAETRSRAAFSGA